MGKYFVTFATSGMLSTNLKIIFIQRHVPFVEKEITATANVLDVKESPALIARTSASDAKKIIV